MNRPTNIASESSEKFSPPFADASRNAGLSRLKDFLSRAGEHYARWRNFDLGLGDRSNISMLSPYLRHRLITQTEVLHLVFQEHGKSGAEKFVQEVFWRSYFKGWLEQHPQVWRDYSRQVEQLSETLKGNNGLRTAYDEALASRTGIECFDYWARELRETGYLHNHARMWFASIWVFTLKLPWQLGADFFLRHLIDGDPASNTLSWRWVSGLHTKGKTYLAAADNIAKFTKGRFNPAGQLSDDAQALYEDAEPELLPFQPTVIQKNGKTGILLTAEDCHPESLFEANVSRHILILEADPRGDTDISEAARRFTAGALDDLRVRAEDHFDTTVEKTDDINAVLEWARTNELDALMTPYAPVGVVAEKLMHLQSRLSEAGIVIQRKERKIDRLAWPHATKGYFKLKKKIPDIVNELGL